MNYRVCRFLVPPPPAPAWESDPEPVAAEREAQHHARECVIGGMADRTVCGRDTRGSVTEPTIYAASELPREGLCVLCEVALAAIPAK